MIFSQKGLRTPPHYAFSKALESCIELFTVSHTHFSSDAPSEVGIRVIIPTF